jgi:predicted RNA-binding Zn-ribbon protein involved in translation (DUF1610 family)
MGNKNKTFICGSCRSNVKLITEGTFFVCPNCNTKNDIIGLENKSESFKMILKYIVMIIFGVCIGLYFFNKNKSDTIETNDNVSNKQKNHISSSASIESSTISSKVEKKPFDWYCDNILGQSLTTVRNKLGKQDDCVGCTAESGELEYYYVMVDAMGLKKTKNRFPEHLQRYINNERLPDYNSIFL